MGQFYAALTCPLGACGSPLHITWTLDEGLFEGALGGSLPEPPGAHTQSWQVQCQEGHVILLPGPLECPICGDDPGCSHPDLDSSDDFRTFRCHDADRLSAMLWLANATKVLEQTRAALNVALAHADGALGDVSDEDRTAELGGCREALRLATEAVAEWRS
jgi:hypothetical protein